MWSLDESLADVISLTVHYRSPPEQGLCSLLVSAPKIVPDRHIGG